MQRAAPTPPPPPEPGGAAHTGPEPTTTTTSIINHHHTTGSDTAGAPTTAPDGARRPAAATAGTTSVPAVAERGTYGTAPPRPEATRGSGNPPPPATPDHHDHHTHDHPTMALGTTADPLDDVPKRAPRAAMRRLADSFGHLGREQLQERPRIPPTRNPYDCNWTWASGEIERDPALLAASPAAWMPIIHGACDTAATLLRQHRAGAATALAPHERKRRVDSLTADGTQLARWLRRARPRGGTPRPPPPPPPFGGPASHDDVAHIKRERRQRLAAGDPSVGTRPTSPDDTGTANGSTAQSAADRRDIPPLPARARMGPPGGWADDYLADDARRRAGAARVDRTPAHLRPLDALPPHDPAIPDDSDVARLIRAAGASVLPRNAVLPVGIRLATWCSGMLDAFGASAQLHGAYVVSHCESEQQRREGLRRNFRDGACCFPALDLVSDDDLRRLRTTRQPHGSALSFPCKAYSSVGMQLGESDPRGQLLREHLPRILDLVHPAPSPAFVLFENVTEVQTDFPELWDFIVDALRRRGFAVDFKHWNAVHFGSAQSRTRVFLGAVRHSGRPQLALVDRPLRPLPRKVVADYLIPDHELGEEALDDLTVSMNVTPFVRAGIATDDTYVGPLRVGTIEGAPAGSTLGFAVYSHTGSAATCRTYWQKVRGTRTWDQYAQPAGPGSAYTTPNERPVRRLHWREHAALTETHPDLLAGLSAMEATSACGDSISNCCTSALYCLVVSAFVKAPEYEDMGLLGERFVLERLRDDTLLPPHAAGLGGGEPIHCLAAAEYPEVCVPPTTAPAPPPQHGRPRWPAGQAYPSSSEFFSFEQRRALEKWIDHEAKRGDDAVAAQEYDAACRAADTAGTARPARPRGLQRPHLPSQTLILEHGGVPPHLREYGPWDISGALAVPVADLPPPETKLRPEAFEALADERDRHGRSFPDRALLQQIRGAYAGRTTGGGWDAATTHTTLTGNSASVLPVYLTLLRDARAETEAGDLVAYGRVLPYAPTIVSPQLGVPKIDTVDPNRLDGGPKVRRAEDASAPRGGDRATFVPWNGPPEHLVLDPAVHGQFAVNKITGDTEIPTLMAMPRDAQMAAAILMSAEACSVRPGRPPGVPDAPPRAELRPHPRERLTGSLSDLRKAYKSAVIANCDRPISVLSLFPDGFLSELVLLFGTKWSAKLFCRIGNLIRFAAFNRFYKRHSDDIWTSSGVRDWQQRRRDAGLSDDLAWIMVYIDDVLILALGRRRLQLLAACVREVILEMGFGIAEEKDQSGASLVVLGLGLHLRKRVVFCKPGRAERDIADIDALLEAGRIDPKHLERLVGKLGWSANCCESMARWLEPVRRAQHGAVAAAARGVARMRLPSDAAAALQAIRTQLATEPVAPMAPTSSFTTSMDTSHVWIATDAAREADNAHGIGGWYKGQWFYVPFAEIGGADYISIGAAEALAVAVAVALWGPELAGKSVDCYVDNTAAASLINKGHSSNPQMNAVAHYLAHLSTLYSVKLRAIGVATVHNTLADTASRGEVEGLGGLFEEAAKPTNGAWAPESIVRRGAAHLAAPLAHELTDTRIRHMGARPIPYFVKKTV